MLGRAQFGFHFVRDRVASSHAQAAIHDHVNVEGKMKTDFANAALFHFDNVLDISRELPNFSRNFRRHRGIHDVIQRSAQQPDAIPRHDAARHERRPIIRGFEARPAHECNGNSDKGRGRSQRITAMMPCVRLERGAAQATNRRGPSVEREIP